MNITHDIKNRATIASGYYMNEKIVAVSRCKGDDTYDTELGEKLVKLKYRRKMARMEELAAKRVLKDMKHRADIVQSKISRAKRKQAKLYETQASITSQVYGH